MLSQAVLNAVGSLSAGKIAAPNPRGDADQRLLSRRPLGQGAYNGKVVWIIGASQVKINHSLLSADRSPACKKGLCFEQQLSSAWLQKCLTA